MSRFTSFKDLKEKKISLIGKRAAILADLYKSGYPVQKGIIVSSRLFKEFLVQTDIVEEFFSYLRSGQFSKAQETIINTEFPDALSEEIQKAAEQLKTEGFAVSLSSPFDEEFGCYNIQKEQIPKWVQRCWASIFIEDNKEPLRTKNILPAVVIQPHTDVQKAGTSYTINPAKMENNRMVIEVVSPRQSYFLIDKKKSEILNTEGLKSANSNFVDGLFTLMKMSKELEKKYRFPQKIDWVFNEKFYITNARKITEKDKDYFLSQATSSLLRSRAMTN